MRFEEDNSNYNKALKAFFTILKDRPFHSICAIDDDGKILGGCGFSPVKNGETTCYLLALDKKWANKEVYKIIMQYPFKVLKANSVIAIVNNKLSRNTAINMGGTSLSNKMIFLYKKDVLNRLKKYE